MGWDVRFRTIIFALIAAALGCAGASTALASSASVTLNGSGINGYSPDSASESVRVDATSSEGVATGTLRTAGNANADDLNGRWFVFEGEVTCMVVEGDQVTVGAVGSAWVKPTFQEPVQLPRTYAQVMTVELGKFRDPHLEEPVYYPDEYGDMLGTYSDGIESSTPPTCTTPGAAFQGYQPSGGGTISVSPSDAVSEVPPVAEAPPSGSTPEAPSPTPEAPSGSTQQTPSSSMTSEQGAASGQTSDSGETSNWSQTTLQGAAPAPALGLLGIREDKPPAPAAMPLLGAPARIGPSGRLTTTVRCPASSRACSGTVTLIATAQGAGRTWRGRSAIVTIATGSFAIAPGRAETVELRISAAGSRLLAGRHQVGVKELLRTTGLSGTVQTRFALLDAGER
jgi:hypothetical protein